MTHLLAIDDDPTRYEHLRRLLGNRATLTIAACPDCVRRLLPTADAVLLDYDLDSGEPCADCLRSFGMWSHAPKGSYHVHRMSIRKLPTVVVSASAPANVAGLCAALAVNGIPYARISAIETEPELRWIGWLWSRGVL